MRCILVRHGKTAGNLEKRYIGSRTDEPLLPESLASIKESDDVSAFVFTSPMLRARQTADALFPGREKIIIEELSETDFGLFEGKNYKELTGDPDYQRWIDSGGTIAFPGGEDPADFRERSFSGFVKAVETAAEKGCESIWIVAHGGTVMSVMSRLAGGDYYDFMSSCAEGYELELEVSRNNVSLKSYRKISCIFLKK